MRRLLLCLVVTAVLTGCSLPDSKSTPFTFDDAPGVPAGPVQDRIALWPLLYHRTPATSVLWPIGEYLRNSHVRLWPLFEVRKLDKEKQQYRVLSPLSQFDFDTNEHHIFPLFWSEDSRGRHRFTLFPLIWYRPGGFAGVLPVFWGLGESAGQQWFNILPLVYWSEKEHSVIFPIFMRFGTGVSARTHVLFPLIHWYGYGRATEQNPEGKAAKRGWRVWPLVGESRKGDDYRRAWALWPLLSYERDGNKTHRRALPFYLGKRDGDNRWDAVLPLFFYGREGRRTKFLSLPWSRGGDDDEGFYSLLGPLLGLQLGPPRECAPGFRAAPRP